MCIYVSKQQQIYVKMRTNNSYRASNQAASKMQPRIQQNHSKFIKDLLNSDSQQDDKVQMDDNDDDWIGNYLKDTPPPLLVSKNDHIKQNIQIQSNRIQKQIKYTSYRLDGQKLIQVSNACQFNSLNLEQASIIRGDNQILERQLQKLKQQSVQQANQLNRTITSLENENKALKRQLNIVKQQMQTKDNYYQQLQQQIHRKTKQIQKQQRKIQQLEVQMQQLKQQSKSHNYNSKKKPERQGEISKYLSNMSRQAYDTNTRKKQDKENQENSQKIYGEITTYIVKRVEELKDRLIQQRMSAVVENIIEEFMTEIVNINPITVSRTATKIRPDCSPIRSSFKMLNDVDNSVQSRSGMLFRQTKNTQEVASRTPTKQHQTKQKSDQLRNLQKSLQKLRQMQKSYVNKTPTIIKDSYDSLDRSSVVGLDKSNRSKSRRKKIFQ